MEETKLEFRDILNLEEQKRKELIFNGNIESGYRGKIIATLSETSRIELIKSSILNELENFHVIMTLSEELRYECLNDSNIKLFEKDKNFIVLSLNEELRYKIIITNNVELLDSYRENIILTLNKEHRKKILENSDNEKNISIDEESEIKKIENGNDFVSTVSELSENSRIKLIEKYFNSIDGWTKTMLIENLSEDAKIYFLENFKLDADFILRTISEQAKVRILEKSDNIYRNTDSIIKWCTEETKKKVLKEGKIKCSIKKVLLTCSKETRTEFLDDNTVNLNPQERLEIIFSLDNSQREKYMSNLSEDEKNVLESINSLIEAKKHPDEVIHNTYAEKLGLPEDMTIGVELEAEGKNSNLVKALGSVLPDWEAKNDGSLDEGVEVVSPVLHDTEEDMKNLEAVCNVMQQIELETTERCGGHIHIGVEYFESNPDAFGNLLTIWNQCEELFYKMANEKGTIPRDGIITYARASHGDLENLSKGNRFYIRDMSEFEKIQEDLADIEEKFRGLNLGHYGEKGKNTIEFRIPNGTINHKTVKENIKLFGNLMKISKEMALNPEYKKEEFETLLDTDLTEAEKVEALLNLLFDDEQTKSIYRERWDSVKDEKIFNKLTAGQTPTFKRGNYIIANKQDINEVVSDKEAIVEMSGVRKEMERDVKERQSQLSDDKLIDK